MAELPPREKEVDDLKTHLRSEKQGVYGLSQQLVREKTRADAAEGTCGQLQGEVKELTDKNATLAQSERSLTARLESMKKNNEELQKEKTIVEEKRNQLDRNVKQLYQELSIAKEISAKKAREWSDLKDRYDKVQEENVLLQEIEQLKEKLNERETKVPELKLIQANISLKNESERCRNVISQLKRDLKGSKAEVVRLERKEQALLARTDKLEGENRLLVKENEGLKLSLESTRNEDDLQASKKECTRLQELVDSLKADQKKTNAAKDDLDRKLRASQEVETSLKAQLGECHQLKGRLEVDLKMAASKRDELTAQLNSTAGRKGTSHKDSDSQVEAPLEKFVHIIPTTQVSVDYKSELGRGSFGTVYKGKYKGKPCAVKIFNTGVDIEKKAKVCSLIQHHENIVLVYGLWYGESKDGPAFPDGQPALVMELCSTNLKSYLDERNLHNNRFTIVNKLTILHQITSAMIYLHSQHIVHGDLSAANVFLQNEGPPPVPRVRVGDFGQAPCVLNAESLKHLTKTPGKRDIMPPEVLQEEIAELTMYVDVFSFGCLVPYVATCVYPKPAPMGSTEFEKRKQCLYGVREAQLRIFEPLMKKCLSDKPHWRGTFEDILSLIRPNLNKYVKEKYAESEEKKTREIEKMKGELLESQRTVQELQEEMETCKALCHKQQVDLKTSSKRVTQLEESLRERDTTIRELNGKLTLSETQWNRSRVRGVEEIFSKYETVKNELETCRKEKKWTEDELAASNMDRQNLTTSLKATTAAMQSSENERTRLQHQMYSLKGELKVAISTKNDLEKKLRTSQKSESSLKKEVDDLKTHLRSKEQGVYGLSQQLVREKTSLRADAAERTCRQLQKNNKELQKEKISVEEKNHQLDRNVKLLYQELSIAKEISAKKAREWSDLKQQYDKAQEENVLLQKSEKELEQLKEKLKEREEERNANRKEKMHLEGQIESLDHELKIKTKSLKEKTLECAELKTKLDEAEDYADLLKKKEKEVEQLKAKLKEEGDNLLQLQKDKNEMRGEIGKLREELAVQKTFTEQKERSWKLLQSEHDHLVDALEKMEREQEEQSIQLQRQKEHFQAKEEEFKSKIKEITKALESHLSTFEGERKKLDMKVVKGEKVIRQKEQEIDELKRSKEALSGEVEEKERELVELKKKLEEEVDRSQENKRKMKQAEATRNEMARLAGTLQSEVSELKRVLNDQEASASEKRKELQEKLKMAQEEKQRFAEQMKEEERVQFELQKRLDQQKEKWESEVFKVNELTENNHFLDGLLKGETVRAAELQSKADKLYQTSKSLKEENAKLESENSELRTAKALFELHQKKCEKHRMSSLATQESTATALYQLKEENWSLFKRCDCLQVENARICEIEKKLRASHNELQEKLKSLETKVCELIQENISLQNEHKCCHDNISRLERDLKGSKAEVVRLERKEQALLARTDKLEREKIKLLKENERLKLSFESTCIEAQSTESEVDLEEFKRQEERKGKVEQMQTTIDRLKELTETRSSSSDDEDQGTGSSKQFQA